MQKCSQWIQYRLIHYFFFDWCVLWCSPVWRKLTGTSKMDHERLSPTSSHRFRLWVCRLNVDWLSDRGAKLTWNWCFWKHWIWQLATLSNFLIESSLELMMLMRRNEVCQHVLCIPRSKQFTTWLLKAFCVYSAACAPTHSAALVY